MTRSPSNQKKAHDADRETADRLQLALSAGQLGDWSWDLSSDRIDIGPRTAECLGMPGATEATRDQLLKLIHPEDRDRVRDAVSIALNNHSDYDVEYRIRPEGLPERWLASRGRGIYDESDQAVGMIGVIHDVTERKRLDIVQHRLATVVESS